MSDGREGRPGASRAEQQHKQRLLSRKAARIQQKVRIARAAAFRAVPSPQQTSRPHLPRRQVPHLCQLRTVRIAQKPRPAALRQVCSRFWHAGPAVSADRREDPAKTE